MEPRTLQYLAAACGGELRSAPAERLARGVCTDSRKVQTEDLFVPLQGERFDAHQFIGEAAARHAVIMAEPAKIPPQLASHPFLCVENTKASLGAIAARYRQDFDLPIIAVAGSNGKTTVKDVTASVLRQKFATLSSEASFNNDVGVPLTLLKLEHSHQAAVLEVGTNHPGELAPLVRMIQPRCGILTSIGREHLEYFKNLDGVAEEEGWLAELLPPGGILFIHGDCYGLREICARTQARLVRVGESERNDWRVAAVRADETGTEFDVSAPESGWSGTYRVPLLGSHQAVNALFAVAAGAAFGLTRAEVERGLAACPQPKMRMQLWQANGMRILDDAYNSNADSVAAALRALSGFVSAPRRVAVLGDMAELGEHAREAHLEAGSLAAKSNVQLLCAVGPMSALTAQAARAGGLAQVVEFSNVEEARAGLRALLRAGDVALLKASRSTGFERLSEALRETGAAG